MTHHLLEGKEIFLSIEEIASNPAVLFYKSNNKYLDKHLSLQKGVSHFFLCLAGLALHGLLSNSPGKGIFFIYKMNFNL